MLRQLTHVTVLQYWIVAWTMVSVLLVVTHMVIVPMIVSTSNNNVPTNIVMLIKMLETDPKICTNTWQL